MNVMVQNFSLPAYHELQLVGFSPYIYDMYRKISFPPLPLLGEGLGVRVF